MEVGELGRKLIMHFEGLELKPYLCSASYVTLGYGRVLTHPSGKMMKGQADLDLVKDMVITKEQAEENLRQDLVKYAKRTESRLKVKLPQHQFDALVSHVYNTGGSDTLFELINNKSKTDDIKAFWINKYVTANGKPLKGLKIRREAEWVLFSTGKLSI